jgi:uncharacterized protein YjdB
MPQPPRPLRTLALLLLLAARDETCAITAGPNGLCAAVRLEPSSASIDVDETLQIRVNGGVCLESCPCETESTEDVRWISDAPLIASTDAAGRVTGHRPGTATIIREVGTGDAVARSSMRVTVLK